MFYSIFLNSFAQETSSPSRLSFLHNPDTSKGEIDKPNSRISHLISHLIAKDLLSRVPPSAFITFLDRQLEAVLDRSTQTVLSSESLIIQLLRESDIVADNKFDAESYKRFCLASHLIARELSVQPGEQVLLVNGRVCHLLAMCSAFNIQILAGRRPLQSVLLQGR